ncbi:MAG: type transport system ATP-binding protein [Pseudonocardiales bacterium]|jgi:ABC-2 type transport system ATP-binding protein|nr:type transport system ATP-binding protein [Pseudonocardiales bacterium]MDT4949520.1 type transport system ATP-binding protein [Pseudonocardiales bacterium]
MIEVRGLTKRYRDRSVIDNLSFRVGPGAVTGFLGPNGSGKTTTARVILGLTEPTNGTATIDGRRYRELRHPLREIGALIDAGGVNPNRTAVEHLRWLAAANRLDSRRAEEVLGVVGLEVAAGRKVGGFSLGMRQRLGIAAALIGDPPVLVLDEPINGLDPEGICWLRAFTQALATEGRTVFLSSHLMSEMAMTATELVVIGRGRLIAAESVTAFTERADSSVRVRSPELDRLAVALAGEVTSMWRVDDALEVTGIGIERVGAIALKLGVHLHELSPQRASLEDAFMRLTADATEYLPQRAA